MPTGGLNKKARARWALAALVAISCKTESNSSEPDALASPAKDETRQAETTSLAPIVELILNKSFEVELTTVDSIWLQCEGCELPTPTVVAGKRVRPFDVHSSDPFGGLASWADRPLVLHLKFSRVETDMMVVDAIKRSRGSYRARTLELRRVDDKWQISKTLSSSLGIR